MKSFARAAVALLLVLLAAPASAGATSLPAGATVVLSGAPDLLSLFATPVAASSIENDRAIDRAATKVVFTSDSDGLLAGDDDDVSNVYVRNLADGSVQLVSRADGAAGEPAHHNCVEPAISADGTHVAFVCRGPLNPGDTVSSGVYVRDLVDGTTTLASRANDGTPANNGVDTPAISGDGRFVAFESGATNLGVSPDSFRIYRRDLLAGTTDFVSQASGTSSPPILASSLRPSISDDGQRVAFDTLGSLDPADTNFAFDVYVRDYGPATPTTTLVSRASGATGAVSIQNSDHAVISGDGIRVVFDSRASNFDPLGIDTDNATDVYSRRLDTNTTELVDRNGAGKQPTGFTRSVSDDGATGSVVFESNGFLLVVPAGGTSPTPIANQQGHAAISGDGSTVAFDAIGALVSGLMPGLRHVFAHRLPLSGAAPIAVSRPPGDAPFLNEGGDGVSGSVSADGRYVAFVSNAPALGRPFGIPFGQAGIYRRDVTTGELTLVSRADGADGAPLAIAGDRLLNTTPQIDADGQRVAFATAANDAILVRDIPAGRTLTADLPDGVPDPGSHSSADPSISDDGSRVAFETTGRLVADATAGRQNVYVRDLAANRTFLVDRATGEHGAEANAFAALPAISGDGRSVAFESGADNLVAGDANGQPDVFVRDLDAQTTVLASVASDGTRGDGRSILPSISRDGKRVAFLSDARSFGAQQFEEQVFLRDLAAGTLTVAARADGPGGAPVLDVDRIALSADGAHLAFFAFPGTSIAPGAPADFVERAYERDLTSGTTRLISRRNGIDGAPAGLAAEPSTDTLDLTADGGCVVFPATGNLLDPPGSSDPQAVFLRAVTPDCGRPVPVVVPPPPPPPAKPAVLSRLAVKPARFFVAVGRRGGTRILFRLDRASAVTLAFDRLLPGHRKGRRCLTTVRRGRRCTVVRRSGRIALAQRRLRAGANSTKFTGRIGRRALAPGSYRLTATPLHGKARSVRFTVVRAPKPNLKRRSS